MVNNRIRLGKYAIGYFFIILLIGCGQHNNQLGMQERTRASAAAKSTQETKVPSTLPKTTKSTTPSLLTMLLFLSQIQPGYNIPLDPRSVSTMFTLHMPTMGSFDLSTFAKFARLQRHIYPIIPLFDRDRDTATNCTRYSNNITFMEQCTKTCNDILYATLQDTIQLRAHFRPAFPIYEFYVENARKRHNRSSEAYGCTYTHPEIEFKRVHSNGEVEYYGWLEKLKRLEEQSHEAAVCDPTILQSPPNLFNRIKKRAAANEMNIRQEIEAYRQAGLLILSKPETLHRWCHNRRLGRQDVSLNLIQASVQFLSLANNRAAVHNLIAFTETLESLQQNYTKLESNLDAQNKDIEYFNNLLSSIATNVSRYKHELEACNRIKNQQTQQEAHLNNLDRMERHAAVLASHARQQQAAPRQNIKQRRHIHRKHHKHGFFRH